MIQGSDGHMKQLPTALHGSHIIQPFQDPSGSSINEANQTPLWYLLAQKDSLQQESIWIIRIERVVVLRQVKAMGCKPTVFGISQECYPLGH